MRRLLLATASAFVAVTAAAQPAAAPAPDVLAGGAKWSADMPPRWNGTLLLWSRGYSRTAGAPQDAPAPLRQALLDQGYALAGSDYGSGGWALAEAVPAQLATIDSFAHRYGHPKRIIAWGYSMGGLVTTALAEHRPARIDGAVAFCASIGGALGMMNMALDGGAAFRTLVAPDAGIRLVEVGDDVENGKRAAAALSAAMTTPEGRARVALAGVLAGLPGWTSGDAAPAPSDYEGQVEQMAKTFVPGVFLPRADQEARAGGVYSWTTGVDYRAQLALSGRRPMVAALYGKAGLDLDRDLARLNAMPRISAKPGAVAYMRLHYTPTAQPAVPLLTVQAVGDGMTSPSLQRGYIEAARGRDVRLLWLSQSGHCAFKAGQVLASIHHLESRLDEGRWPGRPAGFVAYTPPPMLRPCIRGSRCR